MQFMKYIVSYGLFFLLFSLNYSVNGQEIILENYSEVYTGDMFLTKPKWDRTGTKLIATGEHNKGLYIIDLSKGSLKELSSKSGIGRTACWSSNNEVVYRKSDKLKKIDNYKSTGLSLQDTFLYINPKDKKVYLSISGTNIQKSVTTESKLYYNPVLSPNKKMMVVHYKSDMILMSIEDSSYVRNIGFGIASAWSRDGSAIYFFRDKTTDGHQISNSDLFVYVLAEHKIYELSSTSQYYEMWPDISPDGENVVFADEKTGKIYTAKILINK